MTARVLIDGHMLGSGETGNETYLRGLLFGLTELGLRELVAVSGPEVDAGRHDRVVLPHRSNVARLAFDLAGMAREHGAEVIHSTYAAPFATRAATVVTVHDVSFLSHPEWFTARDLLVLNAGVRASVPRAARVLVPSGHARDELCALLGVSRERVLVTPEGVDGRFRPLDDADDDLGTPVGHARPQDARLLRRLGIRKPYVLALGNLQPRKNLARLVAAWARLVAGGAADAHRLVVAGGFRGRRDVAPELAVALGVGDRTVFPGHVCGEDLAALYGGAEAYVLPSLHEGFGLTTLEAMACGTPVACSNAASLPEVTAGAAALFDPEDPGDIAAVLGALLADEKLRGRLRERGLRRASRASWRACAEPTAAAYEAAAATVTAAAPAAAGAQP